MEFFEYFPVALALIAVVLRVSLFHPYSHALPSQG